MSGPTMQQRMLEAMLPADLAERPVRWQQQKSARTRQRLVESAIDCLVEGGFTGLTTQQAAERSGVSRGAMHHHFATRMDLAAAVVDHVFYRRMELFLDDYLGTVVGANDGDLLEFGTAAHWRSVQTREYAAYVELAVAARTDAELNRVFEPAARRYDEVWITEMIESFPQWQSRWDKMKLVNDLVIATHMGLLLNRQVMGEDRIAQVGKLLTRVVGMLYEE
ncbi:TetR/AcrR family transcriptional regulator [Novosphingobium sp. KCTC 2891]|uniref:TetR/AcrR family transcriptional regulator n=1 Tax=Novosphingobium sp. KCTC 2891 TaxID=2989730 RepID=UPI0022235CC5|nr:TetR/AcrR family transcriptional regulator [Novosphingobium sp. KCTC 2891]MCW1382758.1 TetR/AcrR family transcriptional regulator [Novosphingobium sp. KCTC 2891]